MAKSEIKIGAILSYLSIGCITIIGLIYTPFLLRMLGQSEYGLYSLVSSIVAYLTLLDFGFGNAIIRYTAQIKTQGKINELYSFFGMLLLIYIVIGFVAFGIGLILYWNIGLLFGKSLTVIELQRIRIMTLILIVNIAITFPLGMFSAILIAYEKFLFQKTINLLRILLNPIFMTVMLFLGYRAIGLVVLTSMLNISSLLVFMWYCYKKMKIKIKFDKMNWLLLKEVSGFSFFIFINMIVGQLYWNSGQFILGSLKGTVAVAVFAVAIQICNYYINLSTAVSGVLLPKITGMIELKVSQEKISDLFIKMARLQFIFIAFILCGFILYGKSFINIWVGPDYSSVYYIALIMMAPLLIATSQSVGVVVLQARNQIKFFALLQISMAICSILISIPLAQYYSGIGCAIGTSFALICGNVIILDFYYHKKINIDIYRYWIEILKISGPIILATSLGFILNYYLPHRSAIQLAGNIALFSLIYIGISWWKIFNVYEKDLIRRPFLKLLLR